MKIAVIGGGFGGLSAAYVLSKKGHKVTVFESSAELGGLAAAFRPKRSKNFLEKSYHHCFGTDKVLLDLAEELGIREKIIFRSSKTANFYGGKIYPFGTPIEILRFKPLNIFERFRLALASLYLKLSKDWKKFEDVTAKDWLKHWMGEQAYRIIWGPLLEGKFGDYADKIVMAWFWSRIHCRTFKLGYPQGGFTTPINALADAVRKRGTRIKLKTPVLSLKAEEDCVIVKTKGGEETFDKIIYAAPLSSFPKVAQGLPREFVEKINKIDYLCAQCLILELRHPLTDYYWVNINDTSFPFLVLAEHTNMVPQGDYTGKSFVYVGNYLKDDDPRYLMKKGDLIRMYAPYLKKIAPSFTEDWIINSYLFRASFAQPVAAVGYKDLTPNFESPLKNVYLATMSQVYPEDRGMNQAIRMGRAVAEYVCEGD